MLVQCGDMAPPAFGDPPESTTLPTTEECEASSIWARERAEERAVRQGNHVVFRENSFGGEICAEQEIFQIDRKATFLC